MGGEEWKNLRDIKEVNFVELGDISAKQRGLRVRVILKVVLRYPTC